jgi:hypothetical protein
LQLFFRVSDASHAQAVDQVTHGTSYDFTSFALVKLLFLDLLHKIDDL